MKIYKVKKSRLTWRDIPQIDYKWILPIICDKDFNVLAGNCLKESLSDDIFVIVIDTNPILTEDLYYIEDRIAEEGSEIRVGKIDSELRDYFKELRKPPMEQLTLFDEIREYGLITPENYIKRRDQFRSHGRIKESDLQLKLIEFEDEINNNKKDDNIIIDLEILKELL